MEINFDTEGLKYFNRLCRTEFIHEETTEIIVPDSMPDVSAVADADGVVSMRSKEAQNGRFVISGVAELFVLYVPEDAEGIRRLTLQTPFSASCDCPGLTNTGRISAVVRVCGVDARIINSRKLVVRCEMCLSAETYAQEEIRYIPSSSSEDLEILEREYELQPVTDVTEKTFSLSETVALTSSKPPLGQLLRSRIRLSADESESIGSKLIIKGGADIRTVYSSSDTGEINSADIRLPFSVIMDTDGEGDAAGCESRIMLTGSSVSATESGQINIELAAVVQTAVRRKIRLSCAADAYSLTHQSRAVTETISIDSGRAYEKSSETLRIPLGSGKTIKSVIDSSLYLSRPREENGGYRITASARALCLGENGEVFSVTATQEVRKDIKGLCGAESGEVYASFSPEGTEVRANVTYYSSDVEKSELTILTGAEVNEEQARDTAATPSVTVFRAAEGDSLWMLGKRFGTTRALIKATNGMEDDEEIAPGRVILISKQR